MIQRIIEEIGIPTVSVSIVREYTEKIRPPRTVHLKWPFGHPLGQPGNVNQQSAVLGKALEALRTTGKPGTIVDLEWQWKRENYPQPPWLSGMQDCRTQDPRRWKAGEKEVQK